MVLDLVFEQLNWSYGLLRALTLQKSDLS